MSNIIVFMNKRRIASVLIVFLITLIPIGAGSKNVHLKKKHLEWLKLVHYIITPTEKDVFKQLKNDYERDAFIRLFWKQRDPTPGTPENEFRDELIKRFNYANEHFGRGTSKPGYLTDRGKIYILLGPPHRIDRLTHVQGIYPTIIWDYYGMNLPGLPRNFQLVFFKRNGIGDFVLYDPVSDGPESLLENTGVMFGRNDYRRIYFILKRLAPNLVRPAFSLIPSIRRTVTPSLESSILLSKITQLPEKMIDSTYAVNFLKIKGFVDVRTEYNLVKSHLVYTIQYEPLVGLKLLHFSIRPSRLSLDYSSASNKYYTVIELNVFLRLGEKNIYHYTREFSLYFTRKQLEEQVKPMGITINDMFPVPEGKFHLIFLLRNSVNREYSYIEKEITVPGEEKFEILGPVFSYRVSSSAEFAMLTPFSFQNRVFKIEPKNIFSPQDRIFAGYSIVGIKNLRSAMVRIKVSPVDEPEKLLKEYQYSLDKMKEAHIKVIELGSFPAGDYSVEIILFDGKQPLTSKEDVFTVSPENINHPIEIMNGLRIEDKGLLYYKLADEYQNLGNFKRAEFYYERGYKTAPFVSEGVIKYAFFLLAQRKPNECLEVTEAIARNTKFKFHYYSLKGRAYFMKGNYAAAVENLNKAHILFRNDYTILNLLGMSYFQLKNYRKAKESFEKSLLINPEQKIIKKYLKMIKNEKF